MAHHAAAILAAGTAITVLHALGPDHWLPHVVVSRAQGWSLARTLRVTLLAATGHVGLTLALGGLLLVLVTDVEPVAGALTEALMAAVLAALGLLFLARGVLRPHRAPRQPMGDGTATVLLVLVATFPPCYAILPLVLAAGTLGWAVGLPLLLLFAGLTVALMVSLVTLGRSGVGALEREGPLRWLEAREDLVVGTVFLLLAPLLYTGF